MFNTYLLQKIAIRKPSVSPLWRVLTALLLCAVCLCARASADGVRSEALRIREDLLALSSGESRKGEAVQRLRGWPRGSVLAVLKEDLRLGPGLARTAAFNGVSATEASELLPEILHVAAKSEDWRVFSVLLALIDRGTHLRANDKIEMERLFRNRLENSTATVIQVSSLDGLARLRATITDEQFRKFMEATRFELRLATVDHFFTTWKSIPLAQAEERWKVILKAKPVQARMKGLRALASLGSQDQYLIKALTPLANCTKETHAEMQKLCAGFSSSARDLRQKAGRGGGR